MNGGLICDLVAEHEAIENGWGMGIQLEQLKPVEADKAAPEERVRGSMTIVKWAVVVLPLAYLWFRLINNLRIEWSTNPQYSFGWIVPILCLGLLVRRWQSLPAIGDPNAEGFVASRFGFLLSTFCFSVLAFLYLPTRLIEAATPEWRLIQWCLGVITIGLTLLAIYGAGGRSWLRQMAFPITFFLVAIPWPSMIEDPIIQGLTRANSSMVVEILGIMGIPALQHGNLIEVGAGTVGIDEACSGIRSFQSSLMVSLFMGEFYRFGLLARASLVPIGFLVAFVFNVCRTTALTWIAARKGVDAIAEYHDQAGLTILLACIATLWIVAWVMYGRKRRAEGGQPAPVSAFNSQLSAFPRSSAFGLPHFSVSAFQLSAFALLAWLVFVEVGVEAWYRSREAGISPGRNWTVEFPTDNPTFRVLPMSDKTENLLRFDAGKQGAWQETDGTEWQAFYFEWLPGRVAGYLAKRHTPDACLPAAGCRLETGPVLDLISVHGVELPMRAYVFSIGNDLMYVYQCRWEAGASREAHTTAESASFNLVRGIWAGRGKQGQKVLEYIISGVSDQAEARAALIRQLENAIRVEVSSP